MRIEYSYNHLHAEEYLYYRKENLIREIEDCLKDVDANRFLKVSCDKANLGLIYYDQKALNSEIKDRLTEKGWEEFKTSYYVTSDQSTTKEIVKISDAEEQKRIILENNQEPLKSFNQVDFLKDRIAVEVQFGKYFSVAYDLHVKHTFFYIRDDIEVGIEIIPTHTLSKDELKTRPIYQRIYEPSGNDIISKYPVEWMEKRLEELDNIEKALKAEMSDIKKEIKNRKE